MSYDGDYGMSVSAQALVPNQYYMPGGAVDMPLVPAWTDDFTSARRKDSYLIQAVSLNDQKRDRTVEIQTEHGPAKVQIQDPTVTSEPAILKPISECDDVSCRNVPSEFVRRLWEKNHGQFDGVFVRNSVYYFWKSPINVTTTDKGICTNQSNHLFSVPLANQESATLFAWNVFNTQTGAAWCGSIDNGLSWYASGLRDETMSFTEGRLRNYIGTKKCIAENGNESSCNPNNLPLYLSTDGAEKVLTDLVKEKERRASAKFWGNHHVSSIEIAFWFAAISTVVGGAALGIRSLLKRKKCKEEDGQDCKDGGSGPRGEQLLGLLTAAATAGALAALGAQNPPTGTPPVETPPAEPSPSNSMVGGYNMDRVVCNPVCKTIREHQNEAVGTNGLMGAGFSTLGALVFGGEVAVAGAGACATAGARVLTGAVEAVGEALAKLGPLLGF